VGLVTIIISVILCYTCIPGPGGLLAEAQEECRAPVEWTREVGAWSLCQRWGVLTSS